MTDYIPPEPPPGWAVVTEREPRDRSTYIGPRVASALRALLGAAWGVVGLEGAFLILAAVLGAVGASYIHPAGPWFVLAGIALLIGYTLVRPGGPKA